MSQTFKAMNKNNDQARSKSFLRRVIFADSGLMADMLTGDKIHFLHFGGHLYQEKISGTNGLSLDEK